MSCVNLQPLCVPLQSIDARLLNGPVFLLLRALGMRIHHKTGDVCDDTRIEPQRRLVSNVKCGSLSSTDCSIYGVVSRYTIQCLVECAICLCLKGREQWCLASYPCVLQHGGVPARGWCSIVLHQSRQLDDDVLPALDAQMLVCIPSL